MNKKNNDIITVRRGSRLKALIKDVIKDTIPVIAGYLILDIGFGVIMSANGWSVWFSVAMSSFGNCVAHGAGAACVCVKK